MFSKLTRWLDTRRRDRALRTYAIDDALWQATLDGLPFLSHLAPADLQRLREMTSLFIAQKEFSTAHDLELTERITVAIAVQACLPALRQSAEFGPLLWPSMARWDAAAMDAALGAVRAPLLAIQSTTRDAQMRRSPLEAGQSTPYLDLIRGSVPGAGIAVVPDTGHFTQIEAADEVNRLIARFLQRC